LTDWFEETDGDEPVLDRDLRTILASADFSQEITTTVLWLNDVYGTDIRCVRRSLYRLADRLLRDVRQVIPLPEAEELTVPAPAPRNRRPRRGKDQRRLDHLRHPHPCRNASQWPLYHDAVETPVYKRKPPRRCVSAAPSSP
jgi:hypothetical protein